MQKKRVIYALCMMIYTLCISAQHNIYVNETVNGYTRTYIVNDVNQITYGKEKVTLWSNTDSTSYDVTAIDQMSLVDKDPWRKMAIPEKYLADLEFDIAFEESDKARVKAEKEETDVASKYYDDFVTHTVWTKTVNIVFDGAEVSVTGDTDSLTITQEGAHLTINTAASGLKYIVTGQSEDAGIKLYSEHKACIVLNGVNLTNLQGPVINSQLKKRLFIELAANTVNTLTDNTTYVKVKGEDQRGCIFAEGKLCISGSGQLFVNAHKKCGIASDNYVHMMDGFVHINADAEKGKAVYGKDHVIIGGGVLRTYNNGSAGKGITSDSLIWITGGVVKAITTGGVTWNDDEEDYSSSCGIKSNWDMEITGGTIYCLSTGTGGKGISAGHLLETVVNDKTKKYYNGGLTIANADIYVRTTGKRIPEEKDEDKNGKKVGASASPKGIKCINKLVINSGNIYVRGSGGGAAEGIEAKKQAEINGGKIRSYCTDDGMNCSGCVINDGDIFICSSENDGLDAGNLKMYNGSLYAIGSWDAQMGIDTDGKTFQIYGGEITGVGARSCTPHGTCTQASVCFYLPKTYCSGVAVADADGNIITQFPTPNTYDVLCLFFSNDQIQVGKHYKILSYKDSFNDTPVVEYEFSMEEEYLEKLEEMFITLGSKKSKDTTK